MAISILVQPQALQSVFNEMITVLDSDNKTEPNFQFIVELYVNGEYNSRLKIPVNPQGYGIVDLHRHIEESINQTYDFNPTDTGFIKVPNFNATYSVVLKEEFRFNWRFEDNFILDGGVAFYNQTEENYFNVGDEIFISQDSGYINDSYQGIATVTEVGYTASGLFGTAGYYVGTNKGFGASTPLNPGTMSLSNFDLTTVSTTASFTGTKWGFGGVLDWEDVPNWDYTDYTMDGATQGLFLTNVPRENYTISTQSRMWSTFYQDENNECYYLYVETDQGTFRIRNFFETPATDESERILRVGTGPWNITNSTVSVASGSLPVFGTNTTEYSVYLVAADASTVTSETLTFKLSDFCSKYEKIQLVFRDRLGSMIPYIFNMVSKKNISLDKKTYRKNYGDFNSSNNTWGYNSYDRGSKTLSMSGNESYTINSDWVTEEVSIFFRELISSPEVYWIKEDGTCLAINITTNTYEEKKRVNQQIFNYTLNFELANKNMYIR